MQEFAQEPKNELTLTIRIVRTLTVYRTGKCVSRFTHLWSLNDICLGRYWSII